MYRTVLFVALLPFVSSLLNGKYLGTTYLYFFNVPFIFAFLFYTLFAILNIQCFGILLCIFSPSLYSCLFPTFVQDDRKVPIGGRPIAIDKHHILLHHRAAS
jgi:hypothetical protein